MTRLLLAGVAALVVLSTAALAEPARPIDKDGHSYADVPFDVESAHCADQAATLDRNTMTCVPAPAPRATLDPYWGLTANEKSCLFGAAGNDHQADFQRRTSPGATAPLIPDPIDKCNIPADRVPKAMDLLIKRYVENRDAPTWIKAHCHDEAATPRNKWICGYGDVTREYR
jgi:hypothetical protein